MRYRFELFNDRGLGLINANRLNFTRVYVELGAAPDVNLNRPNVNPVGRAVQGRSSIWAFLNSMRAGFALVLVGPPGSGKTTLMQHVLLTFAENQQGRQRQNARLPVFIELRKLFHLVLEPEPLPFDEILDRYLRSELKELAKKLSARWLHSQLAKGKVLVLLDGFDEVPDRESRAQVSAWLDGVLRDERWRKNRFLVSSRPRGYREVPLERADVLEVQPFDGEQVRSFLGNWYLANEIVSNGNKDDAKVRRRAADQANDLRERLLGNLQLSPLTTNPLLLTMICMVHRYHGALPGSRSQLYAEICQVLLERWRQAKQEPTTKGLRGDQKLTVLRPLAAHMMERGLKQIATEEAVKVVADELVALGLVDTRGQAFLQSIQDDSGLLLERERGEWAFAHLTFQEYLAADYYCESRRTPPAPAGLQSLVSEPWWRETLLLYSAKSDASWIVSAALTQGGAEALAFAIDCGLEARSLSANVRAKLEECTNAALCSREPRRFNAAAEAVLMMTQRGGYIEMDARRQMSSWVTAAEYQLFLSKLNSRRLQPHHWNDSWFSGSPHSPIAGIDPEAAHAYCEWLNVRFGEWTHRLPTFEEAVNCGTENGEFAFWARDGAEERLFDDRPARASVQRWAELNGVSLESEAPIDQVLGSCTRFLPSINNRAIRMKLDGSMPEGWMRHLFSRMVTVAAAVAVDSETIQDLPTIARDLEPLPIHQIQRVSVMAQGVDSGLARLMQQAVNLARAVESDIAQHKSVECTTDEVHGALRRACALHRALDHAYEEAAKLLPSAREILGELRAAAVDRVLVLERYATAARCQGGLVPVPIGCARLLILKYCPTLLSRSYVEDLWDRHVLEAHIDQFDDPSPLSDLARSMLTTLAAAACCTDEFAARRLYRQFICDWCWYVPSGAGNELNPVQRLLLILRQPRRQTTPPDRHAAFNVGLWIRLMLAREAGELHAWEGLRVVREPRH